MTILQSEGIGRRVTNDRWLFRGLNISLNAGDQVALQGASGVGKSTLLNLLAGLDKPDEGKLFFEGKDYELMGADERLDLRRVAFGFVFQAFHLMPHLNALQNVMVPCLISGVPFDEAKDRAQTLLSTLGLAAAYEQFPVVLSGGEQQRIALARALVHHPKIVLADEPTGNLDPITADLALELLCRTCREHNTALVMVTHSEKAAECLDRRLVLTN
jgi:putative ABC transport system ATP-binding protein